jgi:hypothetical protein
MDYQLLLQEVHKVLTDISGMWDAIHLQAACEELQSYATSNGVSDVQLMTALWFWCQKVTLTNA